MPPSPLAAAVADGTASGAHGDSASEAAARLRVERSRHVPAFSQATWGLAVHALAASLKHQGVDEHDGWHADGGGAPESARLSVRPERDGVRVPLAMERLTPGSLAWAIPLLFWPFAFLLVVLIARGELPWRAWVVPALFALAPSALLAVRWGAHRVWEALAARRVRRALDAVAQAVADGNRLEVRPDALFLPEPFVLPEPFDVLGADLAEPVLLTLSGDDDPDWSGPFVAPTDEPARLDLWISLDEAEALGARLRAGEISLRSTAPTADATLGGDGWACPVPGPVLRAPASSVRRERRRTAPDVWVRHTLPGGFGEWLPDRDAAVTP